MGWYWKSVDNWYCFTPVCVIFLFTYLMDAPLRETIPDEWVVRTKASEFYWKRAIKKKFFTISKVHTNSKGWLFAMNMIQITLNSLSCVSKYQHLVGKKGLKFICTLWYHLTTNTNPASQQFFQPKFDFFTLWVFYTKQKFLTKIKIHQKMPMSFILKI